MTRTGLRVVCLVVCYWLQRFKEARKKKHLVTRDSSFTIHVVSLKENLTARVLPKINFWFLIFYILHRILLQYFFSFQILLALFSSNFISFLCLSKTKHTKPTRMPNKTKTNSSTETMGSVLRWPPTPGLSLAMKCD